jgi:hypothetical protein
LEPFATDTVFRRGYEAGRTVTIDPLITRPPHLLDAPIAASAMTASSMILDRG